MKQLAWHYALILLVAGIVLLTNLGAARLWDRDEPRNAGCAAEMLARGDWVVPVFNGQRRDAKPVLLYWLIMSSYAVFGVNEFAARLPSALLGIGTVLATYHIGRRMFHPAVGIWGAVILSTTLMFDVAARAATPDSTLIFFGTAGLLVFVLASFPLGQSDDRKSSARAGDAGTYSPIQWSTALLMFTLLGFAVLTKGPVGIVLPTAVIGMYLLIMRRPAVGEATRSAATQNEPAGPHPGGQGPIKSAGTFRSWLVSAAAGIRRTLAPGHVLWTCWSMRPCTALISALLVALPWYVWVGWRTDGGWLYEFFLRENFGRAMQPMENHGGWIWYYIPAIFVGFLPWSVLAGPILADTVRRIRRRDPWFVGYVFLFCWIGVYVGVFSLVRTKLPSYVTPCYPALSLVAGIFLFHWVRGTSLAGRWGPRLAFVLLGIIGGLMAVGVYLAADRYLPGEQLLSLVGLALLCGAILSLALLESMGKSAAGCAMAATAMVFCTSIFGVATTQVDRHQQYHQLVETMNNLSLDPKVASYGCLEPSWVFYAGRPIREFHGDPHEVGDLLAASADQFVITTDRNLPDLADALSFQIKILADIPYFLKKDRLILLGRDDEVTRTAVTPPASGNL